jgi:arylsulfatase A-like enzyme
MVMSQRSWAAGGVPFRSIAVIAMLVAISCRSRAEAPTALRLTALYTPAAITAPAPAPAPAPASGLGTILPLTGWEAGPGVADLRVVEGKLTGRSTSDNPVIHLDWADMPSSADTVHAIVLKLRVSAGSAVALGFSADAKGFDLKEEIREAKTWPWRETARVHPGDDLRTVEIVPPLTRPARTLRHIMIRPTDASGASFAIESIRVVSREDYLESIPSGVSWQGLSEIYHESLVARAPEVMRFTLSLPVNPWLDLDIGTVEDGPVTFRVSAVLGASSQFGEPSSTLLFERTVTRAHRWEPAGVDLSAFSGRKITLTLGLVADTPASSAHPAASTGALGLWGSPVVRDRSRPMRDGAPQGVILVWADTLRRDHLGAYGYARPTSPQIDRLAAEGTLFDACVGQATWTKVATPAMMTSLYPATNGVRQFLDRLPAGATTLAEVFRDAGYATVSYSSILLTGQMTNLNQGFDEVHESGSLPDQESSKTAREYVDRLLPWLTAHKDVPFFVFLHVSDPHDPFKPYAPYDTLWNDAAAADGHQRQMEAVKPFIADPLMKLIGMPSRAELAKAGFDPDAYTAFNEGWYDGSIRAMDAEIGRLMERLGTLGLAGKTLVVFTGDHGEEFLDHGRSFHGQSVYGELNDVPLIFHRPGAIPAGARVAETVESIDIMPTLLAMSGLPIPGEAQGVSLVPLLTAGRWAARPAFSEKAETLNDVDAPPPHDTESFSISDGTWKLIDNTKRAEAAPAAELYDRHADPRDQHDVAASHPEIVKRLTSELAAWRTRAEAARLAPDSETN